MNVLFINPTTDIEYKPGFTYEVNEYSHHAIGGPEEASISIRGTAEALVDMTKRLGYRVYIYDDNANLVWWGFLFSAETRFGERRVNASLGRMANKVAVAYSKLDPGQATSSERTVTGWATDSLSIDRYGTKEMLITKADLTQEAAEAVRDLQLSKQRLPKREVTSGISEGGSLSGLLRAKGEFNRLHWEMFEQENGLVSYEESGTGTIAMGNGTISEVAQSFTLSSTDTWYGEKLSIRARLEGSPTDNVLLQLCADSAGSPGTVLATATIAYSTFTSNLQWIEGFVASRYELQLATTYWLKVSRSGGGDASNYYVIDVNEELGFTGGVFKKNQGGWGSRSPDADMLFRVGGTRETTKQMSDMLDVEGQFLTGYTIESASGVFTNPYRDGNTDCLYELRELLKLGDSNGKRYICRVDPQRHLWIYTEPDPDPKRPEYSVDEFDIWYGKGGGKVDKSLCPVGGWYNIKAMPEAYASAEVLDSGVYFMERSTYRPKNDRLLVDPPDSEDIEEEVEFI